MYSALHRSKGRAVRQLLVQVPRGEGQRVVEAARSHEGSNLSCFHATDEQGSEIDLVILHVPNVQVGPLIEAIDPVDDLRVSMQPSGALALRPPASDVAQQVQDVSLRSSFEVFIAGLQSIGSWQGFLGYAMLGGSVAWLGMFTNTAFLLVAAMLIAPYGGPAMNTAIATARGDSTLLWRSLARYVAALATSIVAAAALSLLFRQQIVTAQMASISNISTGAVLLPLVAGAAGALFLSQAERSSLVAGASVGVLVAASLAPPAALIGMSAVLGRWELIVSGLFLLGLQLVGINLSGAIVFRWFGGLDPQGPRYSRGRAWVAWVSVTVTVIGLAGLLMWQFGSAPPQLQRGTLTQRARAVVISTVDDRAEASLVDATVEFARPDIAGQNTLLVTVYAQRNPNATTPSDDLEQQLATDIRRAINEQGYNVTPLVDVTVLSAE